MNLENLEVGELSNINGGCIICWATDGVLSAVNYASDVMDDMLVTGLVVATTIMSIGAGISDGISEGLK